MINYINGNKIINYNTIRIEDGKLVLYGEKILYMTSPNIFEGIINNDICAFNYDWFNDDSLYEISKKYVIGIIDLKISISNNLFAYIYNTFNNIFIECKDLKLGLEDVYLRDIIIDYIIYNLFIPEKITKDDILNKYRDRITTLQLKIPNFNISTIEDYAKNTKIEKVNGGLIYNNCMILISKKMADIVKLYWYFQVSYSYDMIIISDGLSGDSYICDTIIFKNKEYTTVEGLLDECIKCGYNNILVLICNVNNIKIGIDQYTIDDVFISYPLGPLLGEVRFDSENYILNE